MAAGNRLPALTRQTLKGAIMTNDTTYNGWANRPTWVAFTHISSDPAFMATAMDVAATAYNRQHEGGRADLAQDAAEDDLFEWLEQFLLGDFESSPPVDRLLKARSSAIGCQMLTGRRLQGPSWIMPAGMIS